MHKLITTIITLGIVLLMIGCSDISNADLSETSNAKSPATLELKMQNRSNMDSILEIAAGNSDFSILAQAVIFAGLDEALDGNRQLTVFAPTNAAFEALLSELELTPAQLLTEQNRDLVTGILLYHVAPGFRAATSVVHSKRIITLSKKFIHVEADESGVDVGNDENGFANVESTDIFASNGVIHVIDTVLLPPSMGPGSDKRNDQPMKIR